MTRIRRLLPLFLLATFAFSGCETTPTASQEWQAFSGEVVYVPKARGFWGIQARGIGKINPLSLPEEFHLDGLKISGEVLLQPDIVSAKRWGTVGEVRNLRKVE